FSSRRRHTRLVSDWSSDVCSSDLSYSEAQAKRRLQQLRQDIRAVDNDHLEKILTFFDDHWDQALRYLRKKGMGKHRRGSNSESRSEERRVGKEGRGGGWPEQ